jgi:Fibronectin type III domain
MEVTPGTLTTNGIINGGYYLGDTTEGSPVDARYASGATVNAGTVNLTKFQPGIAQSSAAGTIHVFYDDVAYDSTTAVPWGAGAATAPGAPTAITPTVADSGASIAFTAPASNGGSAITGYNITVTDTVTSNVFTNNGPVSPISIGGLTNGHLCNVTVDAVNAIGTGPESSIATFTPAAAPGPPTAIVASAGVSAASVSFTAPGSNGGSPITGYVATSSPGGFTGAGSASPINVVGLTAGTAYTFTVHATNSTGNSVESAASNSVTPTTGLNVVSIRRAGVWQHNVPVYVRRSGAWTQVL